MFVPSMKILETLEFSMNFPALLFPWIWTQFLVNWTLEKLLSYFDIIFPILPICQQNIYSTFKLGWVFLTNYFCSWGKVLEFWALVLTRIIYNQLIKLYYLYNSHRYIPVESAVNEQISQRRQTKTAVHSVWVQLVVQQITQ